MAHEKDGTGDMEARSSELDRQCVECRVAMVNSDPTCDEQVDELPLLAQLAGGIAHELRNPLSTIGTSAWFLKRRLGSASADHDEKLRTHIDRIATATDRSRGILDAVLRLVHTRQPKCRRVDLRHVVSRTLTGLDISNGIALSRDYLSQELSARIDEEQMELALHNLISNAMEAMDGRGTVTISAARSADELQLRVIDSGPGIAREDLHRVFQPFFTTKAGGTGLGLTLVDLVARRHGGRLLVESGLEVGSTFTLCIPAPGNSDSPAGSTLPCND